MRLKSLTISIARLYELDTELIIGPHPNESNRACFVNLASHAAGLSWFSCFSNHMPAAILQLLQVCPSSFGISVYIVKQMKGSKDSSQSLSCTGRVLPVVCSKEFKDVLGICQENVLLPTAPRWVCSVQQLGWFSELIMKLDMSSDGTNGKSKLPTAQPPQCRGGNAPCNLNHSFPSATRVSRVLLLFSRIYTLFSWHAFRRCMGMSQTPRSLLN